MKGGPILISQFKRRMRQIILNVEDAAYEQVKGMLALCQQVEVVSDGDAYETRNAVDLCVARAIKTLVNRRTLRYAYDYSFIMLAINQGLVDKQLFFFNPLEFIDYLKEIGIEKLPGKSSLYDAIAQIHGSYPDWTFLDHPSAFENIRRKNVCKQFLSAFLMEKRRMSEGISEK